MGGNGTDSTITIVVPPTLAGNCGCLFYQTSGAGVINTVTDNKGGTWTSVFGAAIAGNQHLWCYLFTNLPAGVTTLTINFTTPDAFDQFVYMELFNVSQAAVASAISDKQSATTQAGATVATPLLAAGAGDIVLHWVTCDSGTLNTGFTKGTGFTLKSANVSPGANLVTSAVQYQIAAGSVTPSMGLVGGGASSSDTLAIALKSAAAGTAPPAGIRVAAVQKADFTADNVLLVYQFPHIGNLIVANTYQGGPNTVTATISDGDGHTYNTAQSFAPPNGETRLNPYYAKGVSPNTDMTGPTITYSAAQSAAVVGFTTLFDIVGADSTNPLAQAVTNQGTQSVTGNLNTVVITPINANNVVTFEGAITSHTVSGLAAPTVANGGVGLTFVFPSTDGGGSTEEDDDAHFYGFNLPLSPQTFTLSIQNNVGGVGDWAAQALEWTAPGATASPFALTDFPNPRVRPFPTANRGFLGSVQVQLRGLDKFFGAPGQAPRYDYPNPRVRPFPIEGRTFINPVETQLIGKDKFFGAPGQPPANLDWPNPRVRQFPIDGRTWVGNLLESTLGIISFPFKLLDWPNPLRRLFPLEGLTFLNAVETQLIGQDQFFGAPGQPPAYDWPNPRGRAFPVDARSWLGNLLQSTLGALAAPFALLDWPNPRGYPFLSTLRTWVEGVKLNLLGQDQFFAAPGQGPSYDYPNPRVRQFPADGRTWIGNLLQSTLGVVVFPFALFDWPNPRGYPFPAEGRTFLNQLYRFTGLDQFFGAPGQAPVYDYPNPRGYPFPVAARTWFVSNLLQSTLSLIIFPFALFDWPNPRGYTFPSDARTFLGQIYRFTGLDTFFGAPGQAPRYDYPNPRGYPYPAEARTFLGQVYRFTGLDQFFGAPGQGPVYDWPNPRLPRTPERTWVLNLLQTTLNIVVLPFALFDWPNPQRPRQSTHSWAGNLLQSTLNFFPFSLSDWPNPRGYPFLSTLRTWTDNIKLNLLGKDKFFGAPGQPPANTDWPVPKGYAYPTSLRTWTSFRQITGRVASVTATILSFVRNKFLVARVSRALVAAVQERNLVVTFRPNHTMSQAANLQPALDADGEQETVGFDFAAAINQFYVAGITDSGVTIIGTPTITAFVSEASTAQDATPQARVLSSPTVVNSAATGAPKAQVNVLFGNGVADVEYVIQCLAQTSDGQTLSAWARWQCVQPS